MQHKQLKTWSLCLMVLYLSLKLGCWQPVKAPSIADRSLVWIQIHFSLFKTIFFASDEELYIFDKSFVFLYLRLRRGYGGLSRHQHISALPYLVKSLPQRSSEQVQSPEISNKDTTWEKCQPQMCFWKKEWFNLYPSCIKKDHCSIVLYVTSGFTKLSFTLSRK